MDLNALNPDAVVRANLTTRAHKDWRALAQMEPEWSAIAGRRGVYEEAWSAWRPLQQPAELYAVELRWGDVLVCVWPCAVQMVDGERVARALGRDAGVTLAPGLRNPARFLAEAFAFICSTATLIDFEDVPASSPLCEVIETATRKGYWKSEASPGRVRYLVAANPRGMPLLPAGSVWRAAESPPATPSASARLWRWLTWGWSVKA